MERGSQIERELQKDRAPVERNTNRKRITVERENHG